MNSIVEFSIKHLEENNEIFELHNWYIDELRNGNIEKAKKLEKALNNIIDKSAKYAVDKFSTIFRILEL